MSVRFKAPPSDPLLRRSSAKVQKSITPITFGELANSAKGSGDINKAHYFQPNNVHDCQRSPCLINGRCMIKTIFLFRVEVTGSGKNFFLTRKSQNNLWFQLHVLLWPLAITLMEKNSHGCLLEDAWFQPKCPLLIFHLLAAALSPGTESVWAHLCICGCGCIASMSKNEQEIEHELGYYWRKISPGWHFYNEHVPSNQTQPRFIL